MEIREAEPGDEEVVAKEFWLPLGKEMEKYSDINKLKENAGDEAVDKFREQLEDEDHSIHFLEEGGKKKGFISWKIGERPSRRKDKHLAIVNLYVKEGSRDQGYGTALIEKAREIAEEESCYYIMISSEWGNEKARELYEKLGFEEKKVTYVEELD